MKRLQQLLLSNIEVQRDFACKEGKEPSQIGDLRDRHCYNQSATAFLVGKCVYPCDTCIKGHGSYPFCITVRIPETGRQAFGGACVCCKNNDKPSKCSFWRNDNQQYNYAPYPAGGVAGLPSNQFILPPVNAPPSVRGVVLVPAAGVAGLPSNQFILPPVNAPSVRGVVLVSAADDRSGGKRVRIKDEDEDEVEEPVRKTRSRGMVVGNVASATTQSPGGEEGWENINRRLSALKEALLGSNTRVPDLEVIDETIAMNLMLSSSVPAPAPASQPSFPPSGMMEFESFSIDPALRSHSGLGWREYTPYSGQPFPEIEPTSTDDEAAEAMEDDDLGSDVDFLADFDPQICTFE